MADLQPAVLVIRLLELLWLQVCTVTADLKHPFKSSEHAGGCIKIKEGETGDSTLASLCSEMKAT